MISNWKIISNCYLPAFLGEVLVNYASNMIRIRLNNCTIFWKPREFLHGPDNLQNLVYKSCRGNTQVHLQFFLQTKTLVEIERRSCYVNGFSKCSSTPSEISFHGLHSKSKRPSIRKQIVVMITVNSIIVFTRHPSAKRYFSKHFFASIFLNFWKILTAYQKNVPKILRKFTKNTLSEVLF